MLLVFDITDTTEQQMILSILQLRGQNLTIDQITGQILWIKAVLRKNSDSTNTGKELKNLKADACEKRQGLAQKKEVVTLTKTSGRKKEPNRREIRRIKRKIRTKRLQTYTLGTHISTPTEATRKATRLKLQQYEY